MRVAFVSYDFGEYCIRQANALARHAEVLLVLADDLTFDYLELLDTPLELNVFHRPRLRQPLRQVVSIAAILRRIHAFRPDVIHFQGGHLWFNFALPLLRRYPLVITIHDPRHHVGDRGSRKTPQSIMDFAYRRADQVIVHGQQLAPVLVNEIGIPAERIHVIPHVAIGTRRVEGVAEDPNLVLFFGRIWQYKGLDYFIRAEPLITAQVPEAKFLIAGEGDDLQPYRALMTHPDKFEVHNRWVSDDERAEMFQRASVVVLPYVEATQSGVVPIAYTYAKPVVATTTGGLPDAIEDQRSGLLVPPSDERALAEAVVRLLRDPALRRAMGARGREKLHAESSPEVVIEQTLAVYQQAIDSFTAGKRSGPRNKKQPAYPSRVTAQ